MPLMATTSLAIDGRGDMALEEHARIVEAIAERDEQAATDALRAHISLAFEARLKNDASAF